MSDDKHTPGPWEYVPSTEHHGPYVTSDFGSTICDCYVMSNPGALSALNGGNSRPILHLAEMADPNARLIAAAPDMLGALKLALARMEGGHMDKRGNYTANFHDDDVEPIRAAIAKAEGHR